MHWWKSYSFQCNSCIGESKLLQSYPVQCNSWSDEIKLVHPLVILYKITVFIDDSRLFQLYTLLSFSFFKSFIVLWRCHWIDPSWKWIIQPPLCKHKTLKLIVINGKRSRYMYLIIFMRLKICTCTYMYTI